MHNINLFRHREPHREPAGYDRNSTNCTNLPSPTRYESSSLCGSVGIERGEKESKGRKSKQRDAELHAAPAATQLQPLSIIPVEKKKEREKGE